MRALLYAFITSIVWLLLWVVPYDVFAQSNNNQTDDDLISRYEFAEMLETTTCSTCLQPDDTIKERYSTERFDQLKKDPRIALDDVLFEDALYKEQDYYYCVASVVDRGIMQWFPRETSPYCTGKFCGWSIITYAELIASSYRLYCAWNDCTDEWIEQQASLLVDLWVMSKEDTETYSLYEPVPRGFITTILWWIEVFVWCETTTDKDLDWIDDIRDGCPSVYDPRQADYDNDGIWDSCDDDIDNDGVTNALWVIDFQWILNRRLVDQSEDNCVIIPNAAQEECIWEDAQISWWMSISWLPRTGTAPLTVLFESSWTWLEDIERFFGDWYKTTWLSSVHTYTDAWVMTVRAIWTFTDGSKASAITQVTVLPQWSQQIWYQMIADNQLETGPGSVTFFEEHTGTIDRATRLSEQTFETTAPDDSVTISFDDYGLYAIESQAYDSFGERVGLSQSSLLIRKDGRPNKSSVLQASTLQPAINQSVLFSTETTWIDVEEIENVERLFDDVEKETTTLWTTFSFNDPWVHVITQRIVFADRDIKPHRNIITVYVLEDDTPPAIAMSIDPLIASPWDPIVFWLDVVWVNNNDIKTISRDRSDWSYSEQETLGLLDHAYSVWWDKPVTATVVLENNATLFAQWVATITTENICLWEDLSVLQCDLDNDWLPDLCDDDIDGDWVENRLWLLLWEPDECVYDDLTEILNEDLYGEYQSWIIDGLPVDNCFLIPNTWQEDDNENWQWNSCEWFVVPWWTDGWWPGDENPGWDDGPTDWWWSWSWWWPWNWGWDWWWDDGWPSCWWGWCILPPHDDNWWDGPSWDDWWENPFIAVETCTQCPCPEADYGSSIWKWDRIRAVFTDESWEIIYRFTKPETINLAIPDEMLGGG